MSTFLPGNPDPSEYAPFFAGYVAKAQPCSDPIAKMEEQLIEVLSLLKPLDEEKRIHRYAAGKWSIKDIVGHITDAERIFAYRALRIARADQTPLPGFDENTYVQSAGADKYDWKLLLDEFTQVRKSSISMLRRMPEAAWTRTGTASNATISVRAMVQVMIGHVAHHLGILRERYSLATDAHR